MSSCGRGSRRTSRFLLLFSLRGSVDSRCVMASYVIRRPFLSNLKRFMYACSEVTEANKSATSVTTVEESNSLNFESINERSGVSLISSPTTCFCQTLSRVSLASYSFCMVGYSAHILKRNSRKYFLFLPTRTRTLFTKSSPSFHSPTIDVPRLKVNMYLRTQWCMATSSNCSQDLSTNFATPPMEYLLWLTGFHWSSCSFVVSHVILMDCRKEFHSGGLSTWKEKPIVILPFLRRYQRPMDFSMKVPSGCDCLPFRPVWKFWCRTRTR